MAHKHSIRIIAELREFAIFTAAEQRYIRRSLDVAKEGSKAGERWSRSLAEQASIEAQARLYQALLQVVRICAPDDVAIDAMIEFIGPLVALSAFDLGEEKLSSFAAYRFLYERLLGPEVRPWLASAFLAAAALPYLHPSTRKELLQSVTEAEAAAPGWTHRNPAFIPEWVEKVPVTVCD